MPGVVFLTFGSIPVVGVDDLVEDIVAISALHRGGDVVHDVRKIVREQQGTRML